MNQYEIGEEISFGGYIWCVLDIQDHAVLIITKDIIKLSAYHDTYKDTVWADCALRKYLNGEFYDTFSKAEQSRILPVTNKNPDNPWYGTMGGEDTLDYIFLLSIEEAVCRYFGDSSANLYNRSKNQRYWFQKKDKNNSRRASASDGCEWWWWLRSPGRSGTKAAYVHGDGNIGIQGNNILKCNISSCFHPLSGDNRGGIRPALWLKQES